MKRLMSLYVLAVLLLTVGFASAQIPTGLINVFGNSVLDSTGTKLISGTISFAPVDNTGNPLSYRIGNMGQSLSRPVTAQVTNGAFSLNLADTSLSTPINVCFNVTLIDNSTGDNILGSGYSCVQPAATGETAWCNTSTCDFDLYPPNLAAQSVIQVGPQGATGLTGPASCVIGSTCSPIIPNINNMLYVDPTSSVGLIQQINGLIASCSGNCIIHIPSKSTAYYSGTGTIFVTTSNISIEGDSMGTVIINDTNTTPFLDVHEGTLAFDVTKGGTFGGFTVNCTNWASTCITAGDAVGPKFHDISLLGPSGCCNAILPPSGTTNTSQAMVFVNTNHWMERWVLRNVVIGGFHTVLHFENPTFSGGAGDSFGYGLVDGVWTGQGSGDLGVVIDSQANVYNMLGFKYQFNSGFTTAGDGTTVFVVSTSQFNGVGFNVTGENGGTPFIFAHIMTGGHMLFEGDYNIFGPPNTGGVVIDTPNTGDFNLPFYIGPRLGTMYHSAGSPVLANYDGSGQSFNVHPFEIPDLTSDSIASRFGYLISTTTNKNSPYIAFDIASKFCLFTRNEFLAESALVPVWCTDGNGNTNQNGQVVASGLTVQNGIQIINSSTATNQFTINSNSNVGTTVTMTNATTKNWKHEVRGSSSTMQGDYVFTDITDNTVPLDITPNGISTLSVNATLLIPKNTTAPSGSCAAFIAGTLVLSLDGHATSCTAGTWVSRW